MSEMNQLPELEKIKQSFKNIHHGPTDLQREYDLAKEAMALGIPIDIYHRLYKFRDDEDIEPYPKPKKWFKAPLEWSKWFFQIPGNKRWALTYKILFRTGQGVAAGSIFFGVIGYIWEAPTRQAQTTYQIWQVINSAQNQSASGGRKEGLQYLNQENFLFEKIPFLAETPLNSFLKQRVSLAGLSADKANLSDIKLKNADLQLATLQEARLERADLEGADLRGADLEGVYLWDAYLSGTHLSEAHLSGAHLSGADLREADLRGADLRGAYLKEANLRGTHLEEAYLKGTHLKRTHLKGADLRESDLREANLSGANLSGTNLSGANFSGAKELTSKQVKAAQNWDKAHYDPEFRKQLGLSPEKPKNTNPNSKQVSLSKDTN